MIPIDYMYYMRRTPITREEVEKLRALMKEIVALFPDLKIKWIAKAPPCTPPCPGYDLEKRVAKNLIDED